MNFCAGENVAHQLHFIKPDWRFFFFPFSHRARCRTALLRTHKCKTITAPQRCNANRASPGFSICLRCCSETNCCGRVELTAQTDCLVFLKCLFFCALFIRYKAVYNYKPQNSDELELREGDVVQVVEKCDDGWFVGTELIPEPQNKEFVFPFFYFLCKQNNSELCGKLDSRGKMQPALLYLTLNS